MDNLHHYTIINNPYHILGVLAGASVTDENRNRNRISAYLNVSESIFFEEFDNFPNYEVVRTIETVLEAYQRISLPKDRVFYALSWYGDKKYIWSKVLNAASSAFAVGDMHSAILHYDELIYDDRLRNAFVHDVTHGLLALSAEELEEFIMRQFKSRFDLVEQYLTRECNLCNCTLYKKLFESWCMEKIITVTDYMAKNTPAVSGKSFDYSRFLCSVKAKTDSIIPYLSNFRNIYGISSVKYKYYIEIICNFLYSNALKIVEGIAEYVPIKVYNYSYLSLFGVMTNWCLTLADTVDYVKKVERIGGISLTDESKQMIGHIDDLFYTKYEETLDIIYESFFRRGMDRVSKLKATFACLNNKYDELKRFTSKYKVLLDIMLRIYGKSSGKYYEFVANTFPIFISIANDETSRQMKTGSVEIVLELWQQIRLPDRLPQSMALDMSRLTANADGTFQCRDEIEQDNEVSGKTENLTSRVKKWFGLKLK